MIMCGAGASACITACINSASADEMKAVLAKFPETDRKKIMGMLDMEKIKIYGMPVSSNAMGPVLLAMEAGVGGLESCDLMKGEHMKPEFLAMNPFHQIPTMKDGDIKIGESTSILRYLGMRYKSECYPIDDPALCGIIDFAMDSFSEDVYPKHVKVVYPVLGFNAPPEDQEAANKAYTDILDTWATQFLKGKFVGGDRLTVADYKAVPFLFPASLPGIHSKCGFKLPDRLIQYVEDFCAAVKSTSMLKEAGGFSFAEFVASKVPDAKTNGTAEHKKAEYSASPTPKTSGKDLKVFALPVSQGSVGPLMLVEDAGVGGMEMCDLMSGAHMKPEFLAMNPFHHIPTLKDGDLTIGESGAILRYLAVKYKLEYYPKADAKGCATIDFAMDAFASNVYPKHTKVVYPVMGFAKPPEDQEAANKAFTEAIDMWAKHFLTGNFVWGDKVSIADFKAVPFLFAAAQPTVLKKTGFKVSDRINKYIEDFCAAVASSKMLKEAGGSSIAEYIASKAA